MLRPGDAVRVSVFPDTQSFVAGDYPVLSGFEILVPVIGRVSLADRTPGQLEKHLGESLVQFLRYPHVQVEPLIRISFLGGFNRPGLYWVNPTHSLWSALGMALGAQGNHEIRR